MNKELIFVRQWDKIPEKTWSGTPYHLRKALRKYYEITNIELKSHFLRDYLVKLKLLKNDCSNDNILRNRKHIKNKVIKSSNPIFQFAEISESKNSYIFIDLCVDFLFSLSKTNKELFIKSGFGNVDEIFLERRKKLQNFYLSNNCKHVFTMGKWLRNYLIENHIVESPKVTAVGGGINVDETKIDYSLKKGNKILFIGRDFERKGGDLVLKAFKILKNKYKNLELYIIGPAKNPISEQMEGCFFIGDVESKDLYYYYNLCDVFCMPSYFEAYGLVFIEALCFGLPVIARNAFEMTFLVENGKTGYLLENESPEELADFILKALSNNKMQEYVKALKSELLRKYTWDSVANKCYDVIQ